MRCQRVDLLRNRRTDGRRRKAEGRRHTVVHDQIEREAIGRADYGFKVLIEDGSERVLGAHPVGPDADEVINVFALAIRHGLTANDLKSTMFAYPTGALDIGDML